MKEVMVNVYSHSDFDHIMKVNNWVDGDIPTDIAFISICNANTDVSTDDEPKHWFSVENGQVINLNFDDIDGYDDMNGNIGMSDEDGERLFEFIVSNYGKHFYIHCSAGRSRSQGVSRFIQDSERLIAEVLEVERVHYKERADNKATTPNWHVVCGIRKAMRKKWYDGLFESVGV